MSYTFDRIEIDLRHGGLSILGKIDGRNHPIRITSDDDPNAVLENNRVSLGQPEGWIDADAVSRALAYRDFALNEEPVKANLAERERKRQEEAGARATEAQAEQTAAAEAKAAREAAEQKRIDDAVAAALARR